MPTIKEKLIGAGMQEPVAEIVSSEFIRVKKIKKKAEKKAANELFDSLVKPTTSNPFGLWMQNTTGRLHIIDDRTKVMQQDISILKQDVSGLKEDVSGLKQDVSGLKSKVDEILDILRAQKKA